MNYIMISSKHSCLKSFWNTIISKWVLNGWKILCLLLAIDDAIGRITYAKFTDNEWKKAVFEFWKEYSIMQGKPYSIYLDRFSAYKNNYYFTAIFEPELVTEFGRVWKIIWIKIITAYSPQAKGRVERGNKTLQDRLIKELRLRDISTVEEANRYLQEEFIEEFNEKFVVKAAIKVNAHKNSTKDELKDLEWIFSEHETRKIYNDYTIVYKTNYYQLYQWIARISPKLTVTIKRQFNWKIKITHREKEIKYKKVKERPPKYTRKEIEKQKEEKKARKKDLEKKKHIKSKARQAKYRAKLLISKKSLQLEKKKT